MASVQFSRREFTAGAAAGMAALTLGLKSSHADDAADSVGLRAGAAEAVVSPDAEGTFLIGPMQASTGVNDDLFARTLVLDDGRLRLAIMTLDYLGFDFEYNDRLVRAVAEAGKIEPEHVMINASHNHSAPLTIPWGPWEKKKDKPWHDSLPKKLAEITRRAVEQLSAGQVAL